MEVMRCRELLQLSAFHMSNSTKHVNVIVVSLGVILLSADICKLVNQSLIYVRLKKCINGKKNNRQCVLSFDSSPLWIKTRNKPNVSQIVLINVLQFFANFGVLLGKMNKITSLSKMNRTGFKLCLSSNLNQTLDFSTAKTHHLSSHY